MAAINSNNMKDILNYNEKVHKSKNSSNKSSSVDNKSRQGKATVTKSNSSKSVKSENKSSSKSSNAINNGNLNLPWSCTLGLSNIGKLDGLEMIYHLKNRDSALSLVINSSKSLNQLVKAKGNDAVKFFKSNYDVFMLKHKGKAKRHYKKFYTSRRYKD